MASIFFISFLFFFSMANSDATLFPKPALPTKSGYLPVATTNSSTAGLLFYAFYEAQQPLSSSPPLVIWLQGGPGCSSLIGNFFELGPYLVAPDRPSISPNPYPWNRRFGLVFIDNPLGVGFSVVNSSSDIPTDEPTVAAHLFSAIQFFLDANPGFRNRPLYLAGESYAGKYVPAAGFEILRRNEGLGEGRRVNLAGVAIGNGLTHPVTQVGDHAAAAYYGGLIDGRQREELEGMQREAVRLVEAGEWGKAADKRAALLNWLQNVTGLATLYDVTKTRGYKSDMVGLFLNRRITLSWSNREEVREALGVKKGLVWKECSDVVRKAMKEDIMKSVKREVEELVRRSKVLLYQGIFDLRDGVASTEAWVKEMKWEGLDSFLKAERKVWELWGERAGYVKRWGSLTHVVVAGAGHLVPADQGLTTQAMIEGWILGNNLFGIEAT